MKRDKSAAVGLVICFVAMITIVGAITFSNYEKKQKEELAKTEEEQKEPSQVTQGDDVQAQIQEIPEPIIPDTPIVEAPVEQDILNFSAENKLSWPIDGNVLMNFSMDQTVYFATLDQYKYNPAIIIEGTAGQEVWSVREGKVKSIKTEPQTGITVTVELGNGYQAVYGQLKDVCVNEGQKVGSGELIGYLSEPTKYYTVEGPNLYFELLKDGKPINPLEFFES